MADDITADASARLEEQGNEVQPPLASTPTAAAAAAPAGAPEPVSAPQPPSSSTAPAPTDRRKSEIHMASSTRSATTAAAAATSLPPPPISRRKSEILSARDANKRAIIDNATTGNAHAANWEQIALLVDTNTVTGLSSAEAKRRLELYGKNRLAEAPPEPFWHKVFRQINSILIYILLIAGIIAGGFQEWAEFGLILGVVCLNVIIGLYQEGKAEKATKALKAMLSSQATVVRDGERMEILAEDVVLGDICFVESGDKVPADLRLFQVQNLAIQEAMLTGESLPVNKKTVPLGEKIGLGDRKNIAFSATSCIKGQGMGICIATGDVTEIGKINNAVSEVKQEKTQLLKQIDAFATWVGIMTVPIAIASFLLAYFSGAEPYNVSYAFVEMVAIAVAIIPEGLPALITITFSIATAYMAKNKAIIKTLPAVETLGSVMVICSDKTGTLTKNEMTVVAAQTRTRTYKATGVGYTPLQGAVFYEEGGMTTPVPEVDEELDELVLGAVLCNDSSLEQSTFQPVGDPTEVALVTFGQKRCANRVTAQETRKRYPRIGVIPFESEHKFMVTFHDNDSASNTSVFYCKGAPDRLLPRCVDCDQEAWSKHVSELSGKGLRVLAVCRGEVNKILLNEAVSRGASFITNGGKGGAEEEEPPFLTMLGLMAIMDPPREECIVAIAQAKKAGITTKMITGDHQATAHAIGLALGIVDEEHTLVLTGPELDTMTPEELANVVLDCNVFARASPDNKIAIVRALQSNQQICSMTGDGVNDAPALRAADIGVAMGITGTDVSKDAAKIILTDDNFATILVAVKEGRRVWDNLRKLLIFNMPVAFAQGGVVFFSLCLQLEEVPLSAIQILYVNMVTACTMGLVLAFEPAEDDVMERAPRSAKAGLIGRFFYWRTVFAAVIFIVLTLGSVAWTNALAEPRVELMNVTREDGSFGWENVTRQNAPSGQQHSIALNTLVFCEITYALNCRFLQQSSLHYRVFFGNRAAMYCAFVMIALQVLITYVPGLNEFFSMEGGMDGPSWGICLLFAFVSFLCIELEKFIGMRKYVLPIDSKLRQWCCACCSRRGGSTMEEGGRRGRCGGACECLTIGFYAAPEEGPKMTVPINPKLKQGATLVVGSVVEEEV